MWQQVTLNKEQIPRFKELLEILTAIEPALKEYKPSVLYTPVVDDWKVLLKLN